MPNSCPANFIETCFNFGGCGKHEMFNGGQHFLCCLA